MTRTTRDRALLATAAVTLACAVASAAALAQDPPTLPDDPGALAGATGPEMERIAKEQDLDTHHTPVAKEGAPWSLVAGARFGETGVDGGPTRFDTDLFSVAFVNRTLGLAGGSECPDAPVREPDEEAAAYGLRVSECRHADGDPEPRHPALYRYTEPPGADPFWEQVELPGPDGPGYIGAIAWIDKDRALVVGGTGSYPRRELGWSDQDQYGRGNANPDSTDPAKADVAGKARAWLYSRGSGELTELDLSDLVADEPGRAGMRGLTAVGCYTDPNPQPGEATVELCYAGALGQVWEWRDGAFTGKRIDGDSPTEELDRPHLFRYRVRDIGFRPVDNPTAVAVTSGCCAELQLHNTPHVLVTTGGERWTARRLYFTSVSRELNEKQEAPDSYYSVTVAPPPPPGVEMQGFSVVASPGGIERNDEPSSVITGRHSWTSENGFFVEDPSQLKVGTTRLHDGDGDVGDARAPALSWTNSRPPSPDGRPDWAVGELRSTRIAGLGARGLVVATALTPGLVQTLNVTATIQGTSFPNYTPVISPSPEEVTKGWQPVNEKKLEEWRRAPHWLLPSYSANAVDIVGQEEAGWAVGDRGAILRYGASGGAGGGPASEPEPPRLDGGRSQSLDETSHYDGFRPVTGHRAGVVPAYGTDTEPDEPAMRPAGTLRGTVEQIVISRDGSEGWAFGTAQVAGRQAPAFHHYRRGSGWTYCDPLGIEGITSPDPACKALAPLQGFFNSQGNLDTALVLAAARVPLENDADPSNDDEFEIAAIAQPYTGPETGGQSALTALRYRDGQWRFEPPEAIANIGANHQYVEGMAFTAPDDGWLVTTNSTSAFQPATMWHLDHEGQWIQCSAAAAARCGDTEGRLLTAIGEGRIWNGIVAAGDRVYLYGHRRVFDPGTLSSQFDAAKAVPMILYRDRGGDWTDGSRPGEDGAGLDPAFTDPATDKAGSVRSLSVTRGPDGYEGWAVGDFTSGVASEGVRRYTSQRADAVLLRLEPGLGWRRTRSLGAFEDYVGPRAGLGLRPWPSDRLQVTYPSSARPDGAFIAQTGNPSQVSGGRIFGYDARRQRFELLDTTRPRSMTSAVLGEARPEGDATAMAANGTGGFWVSVQPRNSTDIEMYEWTDQPPKQVFAEVANPAGPTGLAATALAGGPDGSVWLATRGSRVFRHDPQLGWMGGEIRDWDPGRVVTRPSLVNAIAIGERGEGLAVGEGGRIANLSARRISLDPAAGSSCALGAPPPCSTSRDLTAVDIAPGGAALVGGKRVALLWRPHRSAPFQGTEKPQIASSTGITGVSYPSAERAYLVTDNGRVFRGDLSGGGWRWTPEAQDADGELLSVDQQLRPLPLRAIAIDADGEGYAVGDRGLILSRSSDGGWKRLNSPAPDDLSTVELAPGGDGVLIGGANGLLLTGRGDALHIARPGDYWRTTGSVLGIAYLAGTAEGSVDAWTLLGAAAGSVGTERLLRYRSEQDDPGLASPAESALSDAPPAGEDELSLGIFGKSDCSMPDNQVCPEATGTATTNELISRQIAEEFEELRGAGRLDLAVLSGDATDSASVHASSITEPDRVGGFIFPTWVQAAGRLKHARFAEMVADELDEGGVPLLGAIGGQDLSETVVCDTSDSRYCHASKALAPAGENLGWRNAFAGRLPPWGDGAQALAEPDRIELVPAPGPAEGSQRLQGQEHDADGEGPAPTLKAPIGGAATHYAVDVLRDGKAVARLIFVDSSHRSLAASDPEQQPAEAGGQMRFLERMLCRRGDLGAEVGSSGCTREPDQTAIVVSNTPTYSYGPGVLTHTATDGAALEALTMRYGVDLVISGALGYNGLYYTLAPGVHEPCPGGSYPDSPPDGAAPECLGGAGPAEEAAKVTGDPTALLGEPPLGGAVPTLIAAGAGGKFGPDGQQRPDGATGQWHGYTLARLGPDGELIAEQRPILDWIGLSAPTRALRARQRTTLIGHGRSPVSAAAETRQFRAFHYEISSAAITHRYELVEADPQRPWLPSRAPDNGVRTPGSARFGEDDPCGPYRCLDPAVGTVDAQSGRVRAGAGNYSRTYAVAVLSVGGRVATYPLVFEPRASFRSGPPTRPVVTVPPLNPPSAPPQPTSFSVNPPAAPILPVLAAQAPAPPPVPPAPPTFAGQTPFELSITPSSVDILPPTAVMQPPTPPVNPAPPSGARREARQRQAAAQRSGADAEQTDGRMQVDTADQPFNPTGADATSLDPSASRNQATRANPAKREPSLTPLPRGGQPSAWARDALIGGGLGITALVLALGLSGARPTPRRRPPEVPAPAWARSRRRD